MAVSLAGCGEHNKETTHDRQEPPPAPVSPKPFNMGQPDVVLLVTGRTNGLLEVCNCTGPMPGGLSRRSGMIVSYRHAYPRTLAIDTGDLLWVEPEDLRNDYVLKGYAQIGYDAIVLGDQEWGAAAAAQGALGG